MIKRILACLFLFIVIFLPMYVLANEWHPEYRREIVGGSYFNTQGWRMSIGSYNEMIAERDRILEQIITDSMCEMKKLRAVHRWLAENVSYNYNVWSWERFDRFGNGWMPGFEPVRYAYEHQMAWSALVLRTTVCAGYSDALVYLLEPLGIEAMFIDGYVYAPNGNSFAHSWNLVRLGDAWYHLDVTWNRFYRDNEPIVTYDWFLLSDWAMRNWGEYTRRWDASLFPEASANYRWDNLWLIFDLTIWRWRLVDCYLPYRGLYL